MAVDDHVTDILVDLWHLIDLESSALRIFVHIATIHLFDDFFGLLSKAEGIMIPVHEELKGSFVCKVYLGKVLIEHHDTLTDLI